MEKVSVEHTEHVRRCSVQREGAMAGFPLLLWLENRRRRGQWVEGARGVRPIVWQSYLWSPSSMTGGTGSSPTRML